jgi:16S rRNA (cytidine1402-2'-O)-methyltransferase
MAKLYIIATPIGNLKDISLRALEILKEVDLILCEDTRKTKILLNHYQINIPVESYHQHSNLKKVDYIVNLLKQGKNLALVSDSGTPGISDPGNRLIELLNTKYQIQTTIVPIPGSSAITAIASVCGFPMDKFIFMGFPPHKKGRQKFFKEVAEYKYPVILYESPYRIIKTLKELGVLADFEVVIGRELTKKFETIYRGKISEIINQINPRGEFVIVIPPLAGQVKNHEK